MTARIAITGGRGFIGRYVVKRLTAEGYDLHLATRKPADHQDGGMLHLDLASPTSRDVSRFLDGCHLLINLAGVIGEDACMRAVHVEGTEFLVRRAFEMGIPVVHLSSCGVYGPRAAGIVTEETPFAPCGQYEVTKAEGELRILNAAAELGGRSIILRPSIVYGNDMPNDSLRAMIRAIGRKAFFYIGPRGAAYNLVHVEDVAQALVLAARKILARGAPNGVQVCNVSDRYDLEALGQCVAMNFGISAPRLRIPAWVAGVVAFAARIIPGFPLTPSRVRALSTRTTYDTSVIRQSLGWKPQISMSAGISDLMTKMEEQS